MPAAPSILPFVDACLNGVAAMFLLAGFVAIKARKERLHKIAMCAALAVSAAFLCCYLYYHFVVRITTPYQGEGPLRVLYFFILLTHIPLAGLMTPFIAAAVWFGAFNQRERHKRLVRWVWPVWMYVSVTGVLIYLMLYVF